MIAIIAYILARMKSNGLPSQTARTAAAARAAHLIVDHEPYIFADTSAAALLGDHADELISYHTAHGTHPVLAGARAQVTCRSRYTEDALAVAVGTGIAQYLILGAGLDSFAYRNPFPALRVFEVDHPATQAWKRAALPEPAGVTYIPADLATTDLREVLREAGFDFGARAFVSWLGCTMYLGRGAIARTLAAIGALAPHSELVLDYILPAGLRDGDGRLYADLVGQAAAEQGEPWLSVFSPAEAEQTIAANGLTVIRNLSLRESVPAELWERADSLRPARLACLVHAAT
jgi:methyltransferase (TIGR00027 family)